MDRAGRELNPEATLPALLGVFFKLGMTSFGGGLSGWIHQEVVRNRRWMTEDQFIAGLALCQVMPGPNAVNLALFIGQKLRGGLGLAVSGFGILFPPFLVILALAVGYRAVSGVHGMQFVLSGLAAAGVGLTFVVGIRSAIRMRGVAPVSLAALIFVTVGLLQWPMLPVVFTLAPSHPIRRAAERGGVPAGVPADRGAAAAAIRPARRPRAPSPRRTGAARSTCAPARSGLPASTRR